MELKWNVQFLLDFLGTRSNRTFMELKWVILAKLVYALLDGSNRTFMELKSEKYIPYESAGVLF